MEKINRILHPTLEEFLNSQHAIFGDIFLVGGAIRNTLLNRSVQDFDLVLKEDSVRLANKIADHFHGDFYIMDKIRKTARSIISLDSKLIKIDVAMMVGDSINSDLKKRDFTINAIAIKLPFTGDVIDPLFGKTDVLESNLRTCASTAFIDDPVRVIRAVRFINEFGLSYKHIEIQRLRKAVSMLNVVSNERKRDEIVNILEKTDVEKSLQLLREFNILEEVFPEVAALGQLILDLPHAHDGWGHTCRAVAYCQQLVDLFSENKEVNNIHPRIQQAFDVLKRYKDRVLGELNDSISSDRSKKALLFMACIYHDAGKAIMNPTEKNHKKSFREHAKHGSDLIKVRAELMGFSSNEIDYMAHIIEFHMKPSKLLFIDQNEKDIHIHRFFKKAGCAGIMVGLLHLADVLAAYEDTLTDERWNQAITSVLNLYEAYFEKYGKIIEPPKLLNGNDLMVMFKLSPGKEIGRLLEMVVDAQVEGKVHSKEQAVEFVSQVLIENENRGNP